MKKLYILSIIILTFISSCKKEDKTNKLNLDISSINATIGKISTGLDYTIIVKKDCSVWAMGNNVAGQLGLGDTSPASIPTKIFKNNDVCVSKASTSFSHTLLLDVTGNVYGFGFNKDFAIDSATTVPILNPMKLINFGSDNKAISAGGDYDSGLYSLILKNDGSVVAIGSNKYGQLATDNTETAKQQVKITNLGSDNIAITAGGGHSLFLKPDGTVWSVGRNTYGELGLGDFVDRHKPVKIANIANIVMLAAGQYYSVLLKNDGTLYTFGRNENGQLGLNTLDEKIATPTVPFGLLKAKFISAGYNSTLALDSENKLWAFGLDAEGHLGYSEDNNFNRYSFPVLIANAKNDNAIISAGGSSAINFNDNFTILLKKDDSYWSYGNNDKGQLGIGNNNSTTKPNLIKFP